jgi:putative ABC transport system permease protein
MREWWNRLATLFSARRMNRELERELAFHTEMKSAETGDAHAARRAVGNALALRERARDVWGWTWIDEILRDARFAVRGLIHAPGFAAAVILTLALGIAACTLIYSVLDATLLRPLPFREPDRLVEIWRRVERPGRPGQWTTALASLPLVLEWRETGGIFADVAAIGPAEFDLDGGGYAEPVPAYQASANLFPMLGVAPELGRTFLPEEEREGVRSILISHRLWITRFGGDHSIVGATIRGAGRNPGEYLVVGVMPRGAQYLTPQEGEIWLPLPRNERQGLTVFGRLNPGLSLQAARNARPARPGAEMVLQPFLEARQINARRTQPLLTVTAGIVLLMACVNVAILVLSRGAERARELTVRAAVGAGRGRLMRQLLTESAVVALSGGALGALLAFASAGAVRGFLPPNTFRGDSVAVDGRAVLFTLAISALASVLAGLWPAVHNSRVDLRAGSGVQRQGMGRSRARGLLIVTEIALALVLVTGAGLMVRSFLNLLWKDVGFSRENLLVFETTLPPAYSRDELRGPMEQNIVQRLRALPGVNAVGLANYRPLVPGSFMPILARGSEGGDAQRAVLASVSPGFFAAMQVPLRAGREFTDGDTSGSEPVVVVNELAARTQWGGEDPLGRTLLFPAQFGGPPVPHRVIGVVSNVVGAQLRDQTQPTVYASRLQRPAGGPIGVNVRLAPGIPVVDAIGSIRAELASIHPNLVAARVQTMESVMGAQLAEPRFLTLVLGVFAALALAMTVAGVGGVVAYLVRARTYEFAVRMALGAAPGRVLRGILAYGGKLAAIGLVVGFAGAAAIGRVLAAALYGVQPRDPLTLAAAPALLLAAVLAACFLPARRAMRIEPAQALRND